MTGIYTQLRESVYDSLELIFPTIQIVQAYTNNPEQVTPYITFDIMSVKQDGQEYISSFADDDGTQQIVSQNTTRVTLEFVSKGNDFTAPDLANDFYFQVDYTSTQEIFLRNNLSYMRKSSVRKIPKKRETDWYVCYQIDLYFGYQVEARQDVDVIDSVGIEGTYTQYGADPLTQTIQIP